MVSPFSLEFEAIRVAFSKEPEYLCPNGTDDNVPVHSADDVSVATNEGDVLRGDGDSDGDGSCRTSSTARWPPGLEFTYPARRFLEASTVVSEATLSVPVHVLVSELRDSASTDISI